MEQLEARIQRLEDINAIRHLKHYYYCHCVDRTIGGETEAIYETISCFTDDMVADFTGFPFMEGKDAVSTFFMEAVPAILSWGQHRVMNEVIEVEGDEAVAFWYVDCPCVFRGGNPTGHSGSGFICGRYQERFIREGSIWKWNRIVAHLDVVSEFDKNWRGVTQIFSNR